MKYPALVVALVATLAFTATYAEDDLIAKDGIPEGVNPKLWAILSGKEDDRQNLKYDDLKALDSDDPNKAIIPDKDNERVMDIIECDACRVAIDALHFGIKGSFSRTIADEHTIVKSAKDKREDGEYPWPLTKSACLWADATFGLALVRGGIGYLIKKESGFQTLSGGFVSKAIVDVCNRVRDEFWNDLIDSFVEGDHQMAPMFDAVCGKLENGFCASDGLTDTIFGNVRRAEEIAIEDYARTQRVRHTRARGAYADSEDEPEGPEVSDLSDKAKAAQQKYADSVDAAQAEAHKIVMERVAKEGKLGNRNSDAKEDL